MASIIKFSAETDDYVKVEEDLDAVLGLWRTTGGSPFGVTRANGTQAYVNPERIAFVAEVRQGAARHTSLSGAGPSSSPRIR